MMIVLLFFVLNRSKNNNDSYESFCIVFTQMLTQHHRNCRDEWMDRVWDGCTVCSRSLDKIYVVTYYTKWVKTSWTFSKSDGYSEIGAHA